MDTRSFQEMFINELMYYEVACARETHNRYWDLYGLAERGEMSLLNVLYDLNIDCQSSTICFRSGYIEELAEEFNPILFKDNSIKRTFRNCIFAFYYKLANWRESNTLQEPKSYSLGLASPLLYYTGGKNSILIMGNVEHDCAIYYNSLTGYTVSIPFKQLCNIDYIQDKIDRYSSLCGFSILTYKNMRNDFTRYVRTMAGVAINQMCRYCRDSELITTLPICKMNSIVLTDNYLIQLLRFIYLNVMWMYNSNSDKIPEFLNKSLKFVSNTIEFAKYKEFVDYIGNNIQDEFYFFKKSWLADKTKSKHMNINMENLEAFKVYLGNFCEEGSLFNRDNLKGFYKLYE